MRGGVLSDYKGGSSLGRRCVIVIIVSNCGAKALATNWATTKREYYTPDIDGH